MYSKDELLAKSPEELETIAKALGSNLTAADGVEALASYIIGDFDFDAEKEEKPKRKTRTKTTVSDEEPTEEAPKKKRGRPSKKALEEAAALAAQKAQEELEQITETEASTPEEGTEEIVAPAPKKRRARRTKEEILAAAQAKAEALSLNNQKKAVVQRELEFEENALRAIAKKALEKDTGARALRAILEEYMLDIMYEIPKDDSIGEVIITKEYIEHTGGPKILLRGQEPLLLQ